jgi:hypothetical protein
MSFLSQLGEKLPNLFHMGKKGLEMAVGLGEKARSVAHSPVVQGILGFLPQNISAPIQTGIALFDKAVDAGKVLSQDINSGEQMVKRVANAVQLSKKMDVPKMTSQASSMMDRMRTAGSTMGVNPQLGQGISSIQVLGIDKQPLGPFQIGNQQPYVQMF